MSSSELSNDEYDYETYSMFPNAHVISKKARLLVAAVQNDVETLKELLDSPKWYKARDKYGQDLLQIAILRENDEVFDYLLSLDDFPLESVDYQGSTALVVALSYFVSNDIWMGERYAYELIKKGADIDKISPFEGQPLLHCALERNFVRVARLLVERGADVNMRDQEGSIPLKMCFDCDDNLIPEALSMLLCYGADPYFCGNHDGSDGTVFDFIVFCNRDNGKLLEELDNVFFFTFDERNSYKTSCQTLLHLAQDRSRLFHQVIKLTSEIICDERLQFYCLYLFTIDSEYLGILLEKYPYCIEELLQLILSHSRKSFYTVRNYTFNLNNLDMLMQSSLDSDTIIEFISQLNSSEIIPYILGSGKSLDESMAIIYYLLSYGMSLKETDLEIIYKQTGCSEDFKNLLFMDVEKQTSNQITKIMPRLIYDVTFDLHKTVEDPSLCKFIDWEQIFNYFVHPKIQNAYYQIESNDGIERQLPQVPLLQELSRDVFRKYFIETFKITTAKQFYSLIKRLRISSVHEKIITFESKLYQLKN